MQRIVICDDDPDILSLMSTLMELEGFDVIALSKSTEVYAAVEREQPVAVLLDLWMPELNGDAIIQQLKSEPRLSHIPIILISASTDGNIIATQVGADEFIAKPFDLDVLTGKVQKMIRENQIARTSAYIASIRANLKE